MTGLLKRLPSSNWNCEQFTPESSRNMQSIHIEEFHNSFFSAESSSITKPSEMKWADHVRNKGKVRHAKNILVGKLERERRPLQPVTGQLGHRSNN